MDPGSAIGPVASMKNIEYLGLKFFVFLAPAAFGTFEPGIVAATADMEESAHEAYFECALVL
jgi:hypothetical protein